MAVANMRGTGNLVTDELGEEFMENLLFLEEVRDEAPLLGIASRINSISTSEYTFNHFEHRGRTRRIYINNAAGYSASDTSFAVDDGAGAGVSLNLRTNTTLYNTRTRERYRVTANPANNTAAITVERSPGGVAAAAVNDNDALIIFSTAEEEGAASPIQVTNDPTKVTNYTQIFQQSIQISSRLAKSFVRSGNKYQNLKRETLNYLTSFIEGAFIWGEKADNAGSTTGMRQTYTGGMVEHITTNFNNFGGVVTYADLLTQVELLFRRSKKREKLLFCGGVTLSTLERLANLQANPLVTIPEERTYGLEIKVWKFGHGRLLLIYHPELGLVSEVNDNAIAVDPQYLAYRYFGDKDIELKLNVLTDINGFKDVWQTDAGLQAGLEETHAEWDNMTDAAV